MRSGCTSTGSGCSGRPSASRSNASVASIAGMETYLPVWRHQLIPGNRQVLETVNRMDVEPYRVGV